MLAYYPGCTIRAEARELESKTLNFLNFFGVETKELNEWECCGAVYPLAKDDYVGLLPSARAMIKVKEGGYDGLFALCSACFHVLQRVDTRLEKDKKTKIRVDKILEEEVPNDVKIYNFFDVVKEYIGMDKLKEKVVKPLEGEKVAPYYGCLLLRPYDEIGLDSPKKPEIMENILESIGATPISYPYSEDCCGASLIIHNKEAALGMSKKIIDSAKGQGADKIVTSCPLCKYNLERALKEELSENDMEVEYIITPIVKALDLKLEGKGGKKDAI